MDKQSEFLLHINNTRSIVYTVINKYCSDSSYADDLYQDILIRAWNAYNRAPAIESFKNWICRIAKNTAIDRFRRIKLNIIHFAHDNIFYSIPDEEYEETTLPIMDTLSKIEQYTLNLVLQGLTYKEISQQTGEPINRITVRMHRIKQRLSKHITK